MSGNQQPPINEHIFNLGSFRNWIKLLWKSKGIDRKYIPRAMFVTLVSLFTIHLRIYERLRYGNIIKNATIHSSPIFILGHWRSGTTYLHNLMAQDENLGYVSMFQGLAPGLFLVGEKTIKPRIAKDGPQTRLIDNIKFSVDAPQEEEMAFANMSLNTIMHLFSFPRLARDFEKFAIFDDETDSCIPEWTKVFLEILRKATFKSGNKRLVLKSPPHTGRIKTLLKLFPEAKFIHIYRNPYRIFPSTIGLYKSMMWRLQLQDISPDEVEKIILRVYKKLMQKFIDEKGLIPSENLIEIAFEDLEEGPLELLQTIYEHLNLSGFEEAEPHFRTYIDSQAGYQKLKYEFSSDVIEKVNKHWEFALKEWDYEIIEI